jgi:hypothetical protein
MCILSNHAFTSMNRCRRCYVSSSLLVYITYIIHDISLLLMKKPLRMRHFCSEIFSLPIPKLHSGIENHARNPNSNQYYKRITFARAGCGCTFTTKEILISHFLLRIVNVNVAPYAYGVYISQFMLYPRACDSCHVFRDRCLLLTRKILNRGFLVVM